jgi:hypothetical protein
VEWRTYSRTGQVFAASIDRPMLVRTWEGVREAQPGDYLLHVDGAPGLVVVQADTFSRLYRSKGHAVSHGKLSDLSELVSQHLVSEDETEAVGECFRCGRRTEASGLTGVPTCDSCTAVINASREEKRICPSGCGAEMEKVVIQNVVTDRCPSCHGMWLDEGELEIVSRVLATDPNLTSLPGLSGDLARAFLEGGQTTP